MTGEDGKDLLTVQLKLANATCRRHSVETRKANIYG
jgi:hypothetical protein